MNGHVILKLTGLTKLYPGSVALHDAHMEVRSGEVHGIIGKNGAGKSTLVNIISGITAPTEGEILLGGEVLSSLSRQRAKREGISIVTQEPEVIPDFTAAENLFFPDYPYMNALGVRWGQLRREAERVLAAANLKLNISARMSDLSLSEQQLLLVVKAFYIEKARIVILDEATASLSSRDAEFLYRIIEKQKKEGKAVLFISHHMGEILEVCDRVTVLRDGKTVASEQRAKLSKELLSHLVVGDEAGPAGASGTGLYAVWQGKDGIHEHTGAAFEPGGKDEAVSAAKTPSKKEEILSVKGFTRAGAFYDISFSLSRGEIIGIAGLRGSGRTEILKAIAGIEQVDEGTLTVNGMKKTFKTPADAFSSGVVYLPENRDREGLVEMQSVKTNLSLSSLRRLKKGLFINRELESRVVQGLIDMLAIVTPSSEQEVRALSGGNRQKVVVGKIFASRPLVYLLDEPTRGIDISAKESILKTIVDSLAVSSGVVMTSPGLDDLLAVCDRILVLYEGRNADEFSRERFAEKELYLAIHGMAPVLRTGSMHSMGGERN